MLARSLAVSIRVSAIRKLAIISILQEIVTGVVTLVDDDQSNRQENRNYMRKKL